MGRARDWHMEQEERGWRSVPDKYVCPDCFDEECLKQVIRDNVAASTCNYCGLSAEELTGEGGGLIAAPFDSVMKVIADGLYSEWNDADDESITYESAEGGYQAETLSSYDLVCDYVCPNNEALAQEVIKALPDHAWVKRNYYSLTQDQALWYGWENFCELVKHQNRYMFHLRGRKRGPEESAAPLGGNAPASPIQEAEASAAAEGTNACEGGVDSSDGTVLRFGIPMHVLPEEIEIPDVEEALAEAQEGVSASRMLDAIGELIEEVELIRKLPPSTKFFRGRLGPARKPYRSARRLGPPPPKKAIANRMSPAGIPMFYGASDEYTTAAETVLGNVKRGEILNLGAFITLEEFYVLDLTDLKPVPSLFSERRYLRPIFKFLHSFVRDLSRPIKKDGREHTEYVPTQIVTEYFRHSFVRYDGQPIRGILYPSSRLLGSTACVLFFTRQECGVPKQSHFEDRRKQWLRFLHGSAKAFKRKPRRPRTNPSHSVACNAHLAV